MTRYSKMIVALIGALGTWAVTYFPDNHNVQMAVGLASAVVTVLTVYLVPNTPPAGQPSDPSISEQDPPAVRKRKRGDAGLTTVGLVVLVLVVLALAGVLGTMVHPLFWLLLILLVLAVVL